jgi:hypothetical protein
MSNWITKAAWFSAPCAACRDPIVAGERIRYHNQFREGPGFAISLIPFHLACYPPKPKRQSLKKLVRRARQRVFRRIGRILMDWGS